MRGTEKARGTERASVSESERGTERARGTIRDGSEGVQRGLKLTVVPLYSG